MRHAQQKKTAASGTETHLGVDQQIEKTLQDGSSDAGSIALSYREGFAASSGIRPETAETGGRAKAPEMKDDVIPDRTPDSIEEENAGLADH